jgi:glycosyltransferase involved in cell wall biosynthesis
MKIAILIFSFPPRWLAGTEIATDNLAEHLAQRGHEVTVITSHDEGLPEFHREKGCFIHRVVFPRIGIIGVLVFWIKILFIIRKDKPDIVHAQDLTMGIPAWLIRKIFDVPYILWGRGEDINNPGFFLRLTTRGLLRDASVVLALNDAMRIKMREKTSREIYVIPNGIDINRFRNSHAMPEGTKNRKRIIFIGRLIPVKGVRYLLHALKKVRIRVPEVQLIIVGDGDEREALKSLSMNLGIEKSVFFAGALPHDEVPRCLQQADILVLPSTSEGFPNVIIEAMVSGLPVVASRVGGIPDIISDHENGYLVDAGDIDALAERLILLLQDDSLRKTISENNTLKVRKYTWDHIIDELERFYSQI